MFCLQGLAGINYTLNRKIKTMGKKRVRVLHFMSGGEIGGMERAQYQLFKVFKDDPDYELGVAFSRDSGFYIDKVRNLGIPVIDLKINSGINFLFKSKILREFRKFDIHHLHDAAPNVIVYSLLAGRGVKRVFTRRGGLINFDILPFRKKLKFCINKILLRKCDGFSGNSQNAVQSLSSQYEIKKRKIHLLYNGVEFSQHQPSIDKITAKKELKLKQDDFAIGTACHLIKWKRVDVLIRAFATCSIKNKKLFIFGKGPDDLYLRELARDLNIAEHVTFAGEVSPIADYLQALDCFVLASSAVESFGNAVVEAMYMKLPVIVMEDSGGLREHVVDGQTGYVARDENDLAKKIEFINSNWKEAGQVALRSSEFVQEKYSKSKMVNAYKEFYREILEN